MFSDFFQNQSSQNSQVQKSFLQAKRQSFHKSKAVQGRQKIKRTLRFQVLLDDIFKKNVVQKYQSIMNNSIQQIQIKLNDLIKNQDLLNLTLSIIEIKESNDLEEIFDQEMLQNMLQFSENRLYNPQFVLIYRFLSQIHPNFCQAILSRPQILNEIIKQIQNLQNSRYQQVYLDILQYLVPKQSKRHEELMLQCFDKLSDMINNKEVNIKSGIKILKAISPYIQENRTIENQLLEQIIQCYQNETSEITNDYSQTMLNCFIILIKVILYQSNVNIITNLKIMRLLAHAKVYFPAKVIDEYIKFYKLMYMVIKKTSQYELTISNKQYFRCKDILIKKNPYISEYIIQKNVYPLSTIICDYLIRQYPFFLQQKSFQPEYLGFINILVQCTDKETIIKHFTQADFFDFLIQSLNHFDNQIAYRSLLTFFLIFKEKECHYSQFGVMLKTRYNFIQILENLTMHANRQISQKSNWLLQNFDFYSPEY